MSPYAPLPATKCKYCKKTFIPKKKWQVFCSVFHRNRYHNFRKNLSKPRVATIPNPYIKDFISGETK